MVQSHPRSKIMVPIDSPSAHCSFRYCILKTMKLP